MTLISPQISIPPKASFLMSYMLVKICSVPQVICDQSSEVTYSELHLYGDTPFNAAVEMDSCQSWNLHDFLQDDDWLYINSRVGLIWWIHRWQHWKRGFSRRRRSRHGHIFTDRYQSSHGESIGIIASKIIIFVIL